MPPAYCNDDDDRPGHAMYRGLGRTARNLVCVLMGQPPRGSEGSRELPDQVTATAAMGQMTYTTSDECPGSPATSAACRPACRARCLDMPIQDVGARRLAPDNGGHSPAQTV